MIWGLPFCCGFCHVCGWDCNVLWDNEIWVDRCGHVKVELIFHVFYVLMFGFP